MGFSTLVLVFLIEAIIGLSKLKKMEQLEHSYFIVELFNKIFGKPLAALLGLLGINVEHPETFVPDYIVMSLIVALFLILFFGISARKLSFVPSKRQSILELIIQAWRIDYQGRDVLQFFI